MIPTYLNTYINFQMLRPMNYGINEWDIVVNINYKIFTNMMIESHNFMVTHSTNFYPVRLAKFVLNNLLEKINVNIQNNNM